MKKSRQANSNRKRTTPGSKPAIRARTARSENEELQSRNAELSVANNDLLNLTSVSLPVVMVGNDLRIRRFTQPAQELLNLLATDIGRPLNDIRPNLQQVDELERMARKVIDAATPEVREIQGLDGRWHLVRARPYKTYKNKIDGVVISLQDIDDLKRSLEQTRRYADALVENARESMLVLDGSLRVTVANRTFYQTFMVSPEETEGRRLYELGNDQWNVPRLRHLLNEITKHDRRVDDFEVDHVFEHIGRRVMVLNARRIEPRPGEQLILLAIEDVTEKRKNLKDLERHSALLELASDAVIIHDLSGRLLFWNRSAEELYGWEKQEVMGKSVPEVLKTVFPQSFDDVREELARSGHWEGELVHTCRDGSRKIVNSRWALRKEEGVVLEINSDVTEKKRSEETSRQLSARLLRVQDEERRRIARELHDSTGQKLAAVKMSLDAAAAKPGNGLRDSALEESARLVAEAMQEIRTLAQLLHPPLLDTAGLATAAQSLVKGFLERAGIRAEVAIPADFGRLPVDIESTLFRVLQEALNNIRRHSGAKKAKIELRRTPDTVTLIISDNGRGVPAEVLVGSPSSNHRLGVGILGMRERLSQLGGTLEIVSGKKGATVRAVVPATDAGSDREV